MQSPKIIKQMIERYHDKQYRKPKYKLKDLYVAKIILLHKREYINIMEWYSYSQTIKEFAIFYKLNDDIYVHIKSGKKIGISDDLIRVEEGDPALKNVVPFVTYFAEGLIEMGLTKDSKLSKGEIEYIETEANKKLAPEQQPTKLFGL